jgi:hypothetical protein
VAILGLHYGPGQRQLARDLSGDRLRAAEAAADDEKWNRAAELYEQAINALPDEDRNQRNRLELAQARARINAGQMIEGQEQLEKLLDRLSSEPQADVELKTSVAHELATTGYYIAWLMRLEGATAEEWKPEAERARQQFRLLAEEATSAGDGQAEAFRKNLEAAIRLEQMDLDTLKAKPLPKKCCNSKNLSQRKRKQCQSRCQGKGKQDDARKQIQKSRGAGLNQRQAGGS